jgi:hypothetical protein
VATELVAQRGDGLHRRGIGLPRLEPANSAAEMTCSGTASRIGLVDRPPSLAVSSA